MSADYHN
ncbi:hypothetical protein D046_0948A, partial [Vibrio parahaemolyticus V-223/04]